jgi:hypothetical protein
MLVVKYFLLHPTLLCGTNCPFSKYSFWTVSTAQEWRTPCQGQKRQPSAAVSSEHRNFAKTGFYGSVGAQQGTPGNKVACSKLSQSCECECPGDLSSLGWGPGFTFPASFHLICSHWPGTHWTEATDSAFWCRPSTLSFCLRLNWGFWGTQHSLTSFPSVLIIPRVPFFLHQKMLIVYMHLTVPQWAQGHPKERYRLSRPFVIHPGLPILEQPFEAAPSLAILSQSSRGLSSATLSPIWEPGCVPDA